MRLASTQLIQLFAGSFRFLVTLVQLPPPSRVSCTLPSSVPTQICPAALGLSEIE